MPDFLDFDSALLMIGRELTTLTAIERAQIELLITMTTSAILNHLGQDPRTDPEQDCSALQLVAARLFAHQWATTSSQNTGIKTQSFSDMSVTFTDGSGFDKFSQQILNRCRKITIA